MTVDEVKILKCEEQKYCETCEKIFKRMLCPKCRVEYRRGFARCSDCDVGLVDELLSEAESEDAKDEANNDCLKLLWRGPEGSVFNEIFHALEAAGIRYSSKILEVKITLTSTYAPLEIWVPVTETEKALKILGESLKRAAELAAFEDESPWAIDDEESTEGPFSADESNPDDATAEVWSGPEKNIAHFLKSCLAENGIGCHIENRHTGAVAVRIPLEHDARAKEIIRQALEAIPPK